MLSVRAFGLNIVSDFWLSAPSSVHSVADVTIKRVAFLPTINNRMQLQLSFEDIGDFLIVAGAQVYCKPKTSDQQQLCLFLMGSVMGALLQQRGYMVLHGCAVSKDAQSCTVYLADSGTGKSTLAASMVAKGAYFLADDICALYFDRSGNPYVEPAYPQMKLWQHSADLLGIDTAAYARISKNQDKYALPVTRFVHTALPLTAIYELRVGERAGRLLGRQKLACLTHHCYRGHYLQQMELAPFNFKQLCRLAAKMTMSHMSRPIASGIDSIGEYETIHPHIQKFR